MPDGAGGSKGFDTKFAKEREGRQEGLFWTFGLGPSARRVKTPFVVFVLLRELRVELLPRVPVLRRKAPPVIQGII